MSEPSVYATLSPINVDEQLEWKNDLAYLNWARALKLLLEQYPTAIHEIVRFPDEQGRDILPYLKTEIGYFVEVAVTVEGIRKSCLHPVMDEFHETIFVPTATDINSSIQRALTKAIAMHGLALYVYAGVGSPDLASLMGDDQVDPVNGEEPIYEFVGLVACEGRDNIPYYMATFRDGHETFEVAVFGELIEELDNLKSGDRCLLYAEELSGKLAAQEIRKAS